MIVIAVIVIISSSSSSGIVLFRCAALLPRSSTDLARRDGKSQPRREISANISARCVPAIGSHDLGESLGDNMCAGRREGILHRRRWRCTCGGPAGAVNEQRIHAWAMAEIPHRLEEHRSIRMRCGLRMRGRRPGAGAHTMLYCMHYYGLFWHALATRCWRNASTRRLALDSHRHPRKTMSIISILQY